MNTVKLTIATFFFVGYSPIAPGTCGSVVASAVYIAVAYMFPCHLSAVCGILILGALVANIWTCGWARRFFGSDDPQKVVIDEVLGCYVAIILVIGFRSGPEIGPQPWIEAILALGLFRLFDITKPFPIRRIEKLGGGWGLWMDDLAAGVYAGIAAQIGIFCYNAVTGRI